MRKAARAIIIKDDQILVMHRNKFGQEYDILIGGGIDMTETPEQAVLREIKEETGVIVSQPILVFIEQVPPPYGIQYIYVCNYVSGEVKLDETTTEYKIDAMGLNKYQPTWRSINELEELPFRSATLKKAILTGLKTGFPSQPIDITNS